MVIERQFVHVDVKHPKNEERDKIRKMIQTLTDQAISYRVDYYANEAHQLIIHIIIFPDVRTDVERYPLSTDGYIKITDMLDN